MDVAYSTKSSLTRAMSDSALAGVMLMAGAFMHR